MNRAIRTALLSVTALGAFALAGCGQSDTGETSGASVGGAVADALGTDVKPRAGRWETMVKTDVSSLPPELRDAVTKQQMEPMITCLTPEQAAKPQADYMKSMQGAGCEYEKFEMAGGRLESVMTCDMGGGSRQTMAVSGTYGADQYSMAMKSSATGPAGGPSMNMTATSRRVGECDGTELGAKPQ